VLRAGLNQRNLSHRGKSEQERISWRSSPTTVWGSSRTGRSWKVLLIDDDRALLGLLRVIFQDAGFEVRTASNGQVALDQLESFEPDVIVLDLEMPVMNGRKFFREAREKGIEAPVLILSACGARTAQAELGANGYADKPFDPDHLVEAVLQIVK
jgi:DNA-binding response OmpR family regulator